MSSGDRAPTTASTRATGCQRDFTVAADYPAVSPHVIAGRRDLPLAPPATGPTWARSAWQDPLGQAGSGGGLSAVFPDPTWQVGPGVANAHSNGERQVPDVAGPADPGERHVRRLGRPGRGGRRDERRDAVLGRLDGPRRAAGGEGWGQPAGLPRSRSCTPLAAAHQADGSLFHDVTVGANLLYPAGTGWDYATGWGSPRLDTLVPAIVAYVRAHPH